MKGELRGECNWEGCKGEATHWNRGSHAYYCEMHAELINMHNRTESPFPLCVRDDFGEKPMDDRREGYVCKCCRGEKCRMCGEPAVKKVDEVIFPDDPYQNRHELTAYLCMGCFKKVMG